MSDEKLDLGGLIDEGSDQSLAPHQTEEEMNAQEPSEDDYFAQIGAMIGAIQDSVASMHIAIRTLSTRISSIEKHVSYLLEKDPDVGPKIKEHLAKMDKDAGASNEQRSGAEAESGQ